MTLIDDYLADVPHPQRDTLTKLRETIRSVLPYADEAIKYSMPAFVIDGKAVAGFGAFKAHCSYFPHSSTVLDAAGDSIDAYECSKGGLRFAVDRPLPKKVVERLIKLRLAELGDVSNGVRTEYFPDGRVKARGHMKAGELNGTWTWFRRDGSQMRTGRFRDGEQIGTWVTYDRDGDVTKKTSFS